MKKIDLDNEPKIDSGFTIPENYFEQFEAKIMNQLPDKDVKIISIWKRKAVWISGIAAVFAISLGIAIFQNNNNQEMIITDDLVAYEDLSTYDIAEHLTDNDIQEIEETLLNLDTETKKYIEENVY